ncbi:MAG: bifunctional diaminohydroxyphosphoribosylaminopyrimidine deaminase/5-amino-6-(5-phosphoribosylamino)uracil reductase RibD [Clostridiales bacterium]|nr:bifunctional diaminohydroxyphosphoribosylaminopyrimidine deaminase/5-amino-6-(5-phosphoribosylamino)uracil reductase RibD [Clostridiales bacterium]
MEEKFMSRAIELARRGEGFVNPNPLVGAVIVKDGRIIGEGWHERYGGLHAERNAIKNLKESAEGADIYVTLEPCCHHGKQPPCTEAVVEAGIKNVYVGSYDPNPLVSGRGIEYLREHGINVIENVLREECDALNDIFFHYITTKMPYVIMKAAMSVDGRTASHTGDSKWISNELSREDAHRTRRRCAAIMCGINTVLADDPILNCRTENPSDPVRVICDSHLRIPLNSRIIQTAHRIPTIIATVSHDEERLKALADAGARTVITDGERVNLIQLARELGRLKIDSVLAEGGAELHASLLEAGLVDELNIYIAPKIIGGRGAKPVVGGRGVELVRDAYMFSRPEVKVLGDDILLKYKKAVK